MNEQSERAALVPPSAVISYMAPPVKGCKEFDFMLGTWNAPGKSYNPDGSVAAEYAGQWTAKFLDEGRILMDESRPFVAGAGDLSRIVTLRTFCPALDRWEMTHEQVQMNEPWMRVRLTEYPYDKEAFGLHFLELQIKGVRTYALLDTGAEYNVMNWNFIHFKPLTVHRRRLQKNWEHDGALGAFQPEGFVSMEGIRSGDHSWSTQHFSVLDFSTFDGIGLKDKPLMIVGMPFFKERNLLIDFAKDEIWIQVGTP